MKSKVPKLRRVAALAATLASLIVATPCVAAVLGGGPPDYSGLASTIVRNGDLPPTIRIPIYATAPGVGRITTSSSGNVPEPSSLMLAFLASAAIGFHRRPRSQRCR